jgi:hypothetical protein
MGENFILKSVLYDEGMNRLSGKRSCVINEVKRLSGKRSCEINEAKRLNGKRD